jgi:uncharacterized protein (TIGR01244 family)
MEVERMKCGRVWRVGLCILIAVAPVFWDMDSAAWGGSSQDGSGSPGIRNFLKVNEEFCTGGQPRVEHYEALKAMGVRTVINLRQPSEHRAEEERELVEKLGMKYVNIPVVYGNPQEAEATEFLKVTDDAANRPAFIHCTAAIRVGAFWMIRRVLRDGWEMEKAQEEAQRIGLREAPHLVEFARKYIEKHGNEAGEKR